MPFLQHTHTHTHTHTGHDSVSCSEGSLLETPETQDEGVDDDADRLPEEVRQDLVRSSCGELQGLLHDDAGLWTIHQMAQTTTSHEGM